MRLPAPKINRTNSIILNDKDGNDFVLNKKNYYKHNDIFFKDMSFNRWDDVWTPERKQTVFLLEVSMMKRATMMMPMKAMITTNVPR